MALSCSAHAAEHHSFTKLLLDSTKRCPTSEKCSGSAALAGLQARPSLAWAAPIGQIRASRSDQSNVAPPPESRVTVNIRNNTL